MSQAHVEIAKRVTDAFNRREVDGLLDLATPDSVMSSQLLDASTDFRGREGLERFYAILRKAGRSFARSLRSTAISVTKSSCSVVIPDAGRAAV
jgi:hypothetical protein